MRAITVLPSALIVLSSGPVFAEDWTTYTDRSLFFSVNFPADPEVREISYPSE
jgi:hypothetical protein